MLQTANLGFPRIGANRELKKAIEGYWKGNLSANELQNTSKEIRLKNWQLQKKAGIKYIPSNDFSLYDQILDHIALFGAVPPRFKFNQKNVDLDLYFAMARGAQKDGIDVTAMEMTKWFDTNYHYIVPEFTANQQFKLSSDKIFTQYQEAIEAGIETRPVIIGPISFLLLGKATDNSNKLELIDNLLIAYKQLFAKLVEIGVKDLQIDEPYLVTDLSDEIKTLYKESYNKINSYASNINLHLATYFDDLDDNAKIAFDLGTKSVHIDLVRAPDQINRVVDLLSKQQSLSIGIIDGRNIWINNYQNSLDIINKVIAKIGKDRVIIAPSCSLIHCPVDLANETMLDKDIKSWMAFATQKLDEIAILAKGANDINLVQNELEINKKAISKRKISDKIHNLEVKIRVSDINEALINRKSSFIDRQKIQSKQINLPILPTTTIGSFPQTKEVRKVRSDYKSGRISAEQYQEFLENETKKAIKYQEEIDLDVLVHGEFERNDMVEYFGEQLNGFCFTKNGWVQSYGSRCVKPPVIFGDVWREKPMTVSWSKFAQQQTSRYMKGMLTGPITILQWSFVRDDQPRKDTALQIAFAIRDEVIDLEKAGIKIIQIDEAALREGLPIRKNNWQNYLNWAVEAFKVSASGVRDDTQIHTHMCYSEFNDIIEAIAKMDADVISIETSRSQMQLLEAFVNFKYPNEIGPGVYDIHSPRVPNREEMKDLLIKALKVLDASQVWVNPDCGLKTRDWPETKSALEEMVAATKIVRQTIEEKKRTQAV